jgi:L-threonylcarbamoyladenylate synthase
MMPTVLASNDPAMPGALAMALETGQTIVFPTDTVYGIGGNPWDRRTLDHVRRLKDRPVDQPFTLHLSDPEEIPRFARCSEQALDWIHRLLPGPYTLLLHATDAAPDAAVSNGIVGLRVPDHPFFAYALHQPVFGTSVNRHGQPPLNDVANIIEAFNEVDLIVTGRVSGAASVILDITATPVRIVRGTPPPELRRLLDRM